MTDTPPAPEFQMQGAPIFYSRPEPLSAVSHARLGVKRIDRPWAFASKSNVVPVVVSEFPQTALSCPIIFAGEKHQPLAVVGVNQGENLYLKEDGFFQPGYYVPAYVRRYPFILAADPERKNLVLCIDRDAPMIGDLPDLALFDAAGQPTDYAKSCIEFCNSFEVEVRRTEAFINLLTELDLFETKTATYTPVGPDNQPAGPAQLVAEYYAVSEDKLKALPDAKLRELMDNGALAQIHAHLISLNGWDKLIQISLQRTAQPAAANLN